LARRLGEALWAVELAGFAAGEQRGVGGTTEDGEGELRRELRPGKGGGGALRAVPQLDAKHEAGGGEQGRDHERDGGVGRPAELRGARRELRELVLGERATVSETPEARGEIGEAISGLRVAAEHRGAPRPVLEQGAGQRCGEVTVGAEVLGRDVLQLRE